MMENRNWNNIKLGDALTFQRGHDLPKSKMIDGMYQVAGSNGVIGCHNEYTTIGPGITIGRSGNIGTPHFYKDNFWAHNTVLYVKDFKGNEELFLYYFLKNIDFSSFNTGSAVPSLNRNHIHEYDIQLPPLPEQKAIASVLSSLDDKIDLLHQQNQTLEALAETLFRQWFVEEAKEDWEEITLGEIIEIFDSKRVPLSKMQRDKMKHGKLYPYYGAASIMDYVNDYLFDGEYILLGEDGTVRTEEGYPVLQYATGKFWVNNHAHILKGKKEYGNYFIWLLLKSTNIENIVTGAVQPKINQTNLKSIIFPNFPISRITAFNEIVNPIHLQIKQNNNQIRTLTQLRDTLLPKLMSGEVRVQL